jgi:hypothetical protein
MGGLGLLRFFSTLLSVFLLFLACIGLRERGFKIQQDELDDRRFDTLDPVVKEYLRKLADAWKSHNKNYLLAQGEEQYQDNTRPYVNEGQYLALLYRAGPYAQEGRWSYDNFELDIDTVRRIIFIDYRIEGPVLIVSGRFESKTGNVIPCNLYILWRLMDIKLIGAADRVILR